MSNFFNVNPNSVEVCDNYFLPITIRSNYNVYVPHVSKCDAYVNYDFFFYITIVL